MATQEDLTEYERRRLENIKRNNEMMGSLKLQSKAQQLLLTANKRQRLSPQKSYKTQQPKKTKSETPVVIRRSLRTRGIPPSSSSSEASNSIEADSVSFPKFYPSILVSFGMKDAYIDSSETQTLVHTIKEMSAVEENVSVPGSINKEKGEGNDLFSTKKEDMEGNELFSIKKEDMEGNGLFSIKEEQAEGNKGYLDLGSMVLKGENIARVVSGRILSLKFFPCADRRLIAAGNNNGMVVFWDADCKEKEDNGIYQYRPHPAPISGFVIHPFSLSKVISSCYDGFVRLMDVEKESFDLIHASDESIYSLSQQQQNTNSLYFGEGRGLVNVWDMRVSKSSSSWNLHDMRINTIDFNPENTNMMATSSTDGTARIWDLRYIDANGSKFLKMVDHGKAVHSAYFSPSGNSLLTTSINDKIGTCSGVDFAETSMISHNNQTGRWISKFRAIWGWDDSYIFVGNMKRGVDVISTIDKKTVTLQSSLMSAISCRFVVHPYQVGTLAAATSGGQIYLWTSS